MNDRAHEHSAVCRYEHQFRLKGDIHLYRVAQKEFNNFDS